MNQLEKLVAICFNKNPRRSPRKTERDLASPRSSIQITISNRIQMFPYKIQIVQKLQESAYPARTWFVNFLSAKHSIRILHFDPNNHLRWIFTSGALKSQ